MSDKASNSWDGVDKATRYAEAVVYARTLFERDARSEHFQNAFLDWDSAIEQWGQQQTDILALSWVHNTNKTKEEKAANIIARALKDPLGFHAARNVVEGMIQRGEEMPDILRCWAAALMWGVVQPPKRSGKPEISHKLWFIVLAGRVKIVAREFDLNASKNAVRSPRTVKAYCACDAIVDGWRGFLQTLPKDRRVGFPTLSYSTVNKAYWAFNQTPRTIEKYG